MLKDRLSQDLKASMKAREAFAVDTLRMLLAGIKNEEISKRRALSEDEELAVLRRAVKSREDSIALFEKGGRQELADAEKREIDLILGYLPSRLSEDEMGAAIDDVIRDLGITSKKDLGRVMKELMARHPGKVDGRAANKLAAARLS